MSWLFSKALMKDYENSLCLQDLVEEYSGASSSAGEQSAQSNMTNTPVMYLSHGKTTDVSNLSRFGMTCEPLMENRGEELLMWFREGFRVKTLVAPKQQVKELTGIKVDCGANNIEYFARFDHDSGGWKTAQCSLFEDWDEFSETWPRWGIMLDGVCLEQQPPHGLGWCEKEFGSWPSVTKSMSNDYRFKVESMLKVGFGATQHRLTYQMLKVHGIWPTAMLCERLMMWPEQWTELNVSAMDKYQQWCEQHGTSCAKKTGRKKDE